ncbi:MAG: flagellar basal body-associated FliL family protein [Verrucomicrobiae bacterium]|nr:flagellar basal body-associated FliL family protein [Verrucomicrobiae bacterium]
MTPQLKERGVKVAANGRITIPLNKILVNVAGTMGSRYLLTSVTLSGSKPNFVDLVLGHEAQLMDLAAGVLSAKTLSDLEKPNSRQTVRTELLTVFNNVLGSGTVEEIFFTEFAIQ